MMHDVSPQALLDRLQKMTALEFMALGANHLSYIARIDDDLYGLYDARGELITHGPDVAILQAKALQDDMLAMMAQ